MGSIKNKFSSIKSKITAAVSGIAIIGGVGAGRSAFEFIPKFFKPPKPKIEIRDPFSPKIEPKVKEVDIYGNKKEKIEYKNGRYYENTYLKTNLSSTEKLKIIVQKENEYFASTKKVKELNIKIKNLQKQNNNPELLTKYEKELEVEKRINKKLQYEAFKDVDIKKRIEDSSKLIEQISSKHRHPSTDLEITTDGFAMNGKSISIAEIKEQIKINPNVVIKGKLSEQHILTLREMGIDMVFDNNAYILSSFQENYQFIFVAPKEEVQLSKIFSKTKNISQSSLVRNKEDLITSIENAKQNKRNPILIFDNKNDLLFDEPIFKYGVQDVITCNSYAIENGGFSMLTTNYVNAANVVKALGKIPNEPMYKVDMYMQFSKNYYELQNITTKKQGLIYAGFGIGTGGGIITIVFINKK